MSTSMSGEARAERVKVTAHALIVQLVDGRKLEVPLVWFPRLYKATPLQRKQYRFIGHGVGIHWPKIDEDISVDGLLNVSKYPLSTSDENEKGRKKSAA
ncbi:MAG: DUF2442 domain-containing protein [Candidatus Omnitrophica bacterium]|nr:DUF2442 domain-containing protein [Candidatus Omnitrophota bacterium]